MRRFGPTLLLAVIAALGPAVPAQEMEARAYSPAPVGANVAVLVYSHQAGDVGVDATLPLSDIRAKFSAVTVGYGRTFNLAGRQATASIGLPYVWGRVSGKVFEQQQQVTRSGLGDARLRLMINLIGSPALSPREFAARKPSTLLGASITIAIPTGQYDPVRLVNIGSNRFAFKPELAVSQPIGPWTLELMGGVWLFTQNNEFFGTSRRKQKPLPSFQGHVIYTLRPRMWLAVDATYYIGGRTVINDVVNADFQRSSRVGATFSVPVGPAHSLKVVWARGVTARIGGDLSVLAVGWQYTWLK